MITHQDHLVNLELLNIARRTMGGFGGRDKLAFIPGGDMSGGGGAPPGGDPAAMGGMPPGMDPAAMGGMPPGMDPAAMGGGGGGGGGDQMAIIQQLQQQVQQLQQQIQSGGGGGGGAAGGGMLKPKIDINVEIMKLNKMVARIADALGVQIPAHEMVATPQDLTSMAQGQQSSDAAGAAGSAGAIPPVGPMQGMAPAGVPGGGGEKAGSWGGRNKGKQAFDNGTAFNSSGLVETQNRAVAIARVLGYARRNGD